MKKQDAKTINLRDSGVLPESVRDLLAAIEDWGCGFETCDTVPDAQYYTTSDDLTLLLTEYELNNSKSVA